MFTNIKENACPCLKCDTLPFWNEGTDGKDM